MSKNDDAIKLSFADVKFEKVSKSGQPILSIELSPELLDPLPSELLIHFDNEELIECQSIINEWVQREKS